LRADRGVAMAAVSQDGYALKFVCPALRQDRDVAMAAVKVQGLTLALLGNALRSDPAVAREAVRNDERAVQHVLGADALRTIVRGNGLLLQYVFNDAAKAAEQRLGLAQHVAPAKLEARRVALEAVRQNGLALQFAAAFQGDKDLVRAAVAQRGIALQYAAQVLIADREVVLDAVREDGSALEFVSEELRNDAAVVLTAVGEDGHPENSDGRVLSFASRSLRGDRRVVLAAVRTRGFALQHAALRSDREVVLAAVRQNGLALKFASVCLRQDRAVCLAAAEQNGLAFAHASPELQDDQSFVSRVISVSPAALALRADAAQLRKAGCRQDSAGNLVFHSLSGDTKILEPDRIPSMRLGGRSRSPPVRKHGTMHDVFLDVELVASRQAKRGELQASMNERIKTGWCHVQAEKRKEMHRRDTRLPMPFRSPNFL